MESNDSVHWSLYRRYTKKFINVSILLFYTHWHTIHCPLHYYIRLLNSVLEKKQCEVRHLPIPQFLNSLQLITALVCRFILRFNSWPIIITDAINRKKRCRCSLRFTFFWQMNSIERSNADAVSGLHSFDRCIQSNEAMQMQSDVEIRRHLPEGESSSSGRQRPKQPAPLPPQQQLLQQQHQEQLQHQQDQQDEDYACHRQSRRWLLPETGLLRIKKDGPGSESLNSLLWFKSPFIWRLTPVVLRPSFEKNDVSWNYARNLFYNCCLTL